MKDRHAILRRAAQNFLLLPPIQCPRRDMIISLPEDVQNQILQRLAEAGQPETGVSFRIKLFGGHHGQFKRAVIRPQAAVRTYCDKAGTPTARKMTGRKISSPRLLPVGKFTDYLREVKVRVKAFESSLQDFLPYYDEYLEAGMASVNHNFPFNVTWQGRNVPVGDVVASLAPSRDEFAESFSVIIPSPQRLTVADFSDLSIPGDLADKWAEQSVQAVEEQLDNAKERLIDDALKLVKRVSKQLHNPNGKLYKTLITDAAALGESLKTMVEGYDPADLQLRNAAAAIEEQIGRVKSPEVWRESYLERDKSLRAANAAEKVLTASKDILQRKRADVSEKPPTGHVVTGGMLDDLL